MKNKLAYCDMLENKQIEQFSHRFWLVPESACVLAIVNMIQLYTSVFLERGKSFHAEDLKY